MSDDEITGTRHLVVSATVVTQDQGRAARAAEVLARAATGLGLEGLNVSITIGTAVDIEDDD
jgi:hypothetical protein